MNVIQEIQKRMMSIAIGLLVVNVLTLITGFIAISSFSEFLLRMILVNAFALPLFIVVYFWRFK